MVASDTARMGIIRRSRESGTATRVRYSDVRRAIRSHLADPHRNQGILNTARDTFGQRSNDSSQSDFARDDARLSIDVLDSFGRMRNALGGYDFVAAPRQQPSLVIANVEVPVNLDALVHRSRDGAEQSGGALFRFTKSDDESDQAASRRREMGLYAATIVLMHVRENLAGNRTPDHRLCLSVDVQCNEVHVAPRTYAQRASNLENACRFIAALWNAA